MAQEVRASEGRIRDEVERRVAEEVDRKVPDLPEGISADGTVTPEGVANFLKLPAARDSKDLQNALDSYVANDKTLLRGVTEANPYTQDAYAAVDAVRAVDPPRGRVSWSAVSPRDRRTLSPASTARRLSRRPS